MAISTEDERKMLKGAAMGGELKQGRYFKIRRVIKSFEDIDEYCDQQESKGGAQDAILKWMKCSSDTTNATLDKTSKVLERMSARLDALEG